jgi:hypothetical protein
MLTMTQEKQSLELAFLVAGFYREELVSGKMV